MQLALVLSAKGDPAGAANVYRELIRQQPEMAEAHNNLGLVLLEINRFDGSAPGVSTRAGTEARDSHPHFRMPS